MVLPEPSSRFIQRNASMRQLLSIVTEVIVFLFLCNSVLRAQESDVVWVPNLVGDGKADPEKMEEARLLARAHVYAAAMSRVGLDFQPEMLLAQGVSMQGPAERLRSNDAFVTLLRAGTRGFVSGLRNLKWTTNRRAAAFSDSQQVTVRLMCDARVVKARGSPDPSFFVNVDLNQPKYWTGEKVGIRLAPSQDAFLTVYHLAGDSVRVLFPREGMAEAPILAQQELRLPYSLDVWEAAVPEGWESTEDLIVVVASKDPPSQHKSLLTAQERYPTIREALLMEMVGDLLSSGPSRSAVSAARLTIVRN
jgi:hypothetical protein